MSLLDFLRKKKKKAIEQAKPPVPPRPRPRQQVFKPTKDTKTIGKILQEIEENQKTLAEKIPQWIEKQDVARYILPQALVDVEAEKWLSADYGIMFVMMMPGATVGLQKRICIYADKIEVQEKGYRLAANNYLQDRNYMLRDNKNIPSGVIYLAYRAFFKDEESFIEALRGAFEVYRKDYRK